MSKISINKPETGIFPQRPRPVTNIPPTSNPIATRLPVPGQKLPPTSAPVSGGRNGMSLPQSNTIPSKPGRYPVHLRSEVETPIDALSKAAANMIAHPAVLDKISRLPGQAPSWSDNGSQGSPSSPKLIGGLPYDTFRTLSGEGSTPYETFRTLSEKSSAPNDPIPTFSGTQNDLVFNYVIRSALPVKGFNAEHASSTLDQYRASLRNEVTGAHPLSDLMQRKSFMNMNPQEMREYYTEADRLHELFTDITRAERFILSSHPNDPASPSTPTPSSKDPYFNKGKRSSGTNPNTGHEDHPDRKRGKYEKEILDDDEAKGFFDEVYGVAKDIQTTRSSAKLFKHLYGNPGAQVEYGKQMQKNIRSKINKTFEKAGKLGSKIGPVAEEGSILYNPNKTPSVINDEGYIKLPDPELEHDPLFAEEEPLIGAEAGAEVGAEIGAEVGAEAAATAEAGIIGGVAGAASGVGAVAGAVLVGYDVYKLAGGEGRSPFLEAVGKGLGAVNTFMYEGVNFAADQIGLGSLTRGAEAAFGDVAYGAVKGVADVAQGFAKATHASSVGEGIVDVAEGVAHGVVDVATNVAEGVKDLWHGLTGIFH